MEPATLSRYCTGVKATTESTSASADASTTPGLWLNTLRVRFGLLLALALLPWLILTGLEALRSASESRASEARNLDLLSSNKVSEIALILEAGRFGLAAAPEMIRDQGCERGSAELLQRLDAFEAFVVQDASGAVTCQYPSRLQSLQLINASDFVDDFRIELGRIDHGAASAPDSGDRDGEGAPSGLRDAVLLQTRSERTGDVRTLVLPTTLGLRDVLDVALGDGSTIALTKPDAGVILGRPVTPEQVEFFRSQISEDRISLIDMEGPDATPRRFASTYVEDLGIYITVGRDVKSPRGVGMFNDNTAILLPILAWLVGFGLIWVGTQTMLITPLARMRAAAREYAAGRLGGRVTLSDSAAGEVRGLAQTFNRMAGQLQDRDNRIADNMDEKDTLLREIHHRVKNNLQIIISLLNMQERKVSSREAIEAITETRARINAIATVHRGLYESDDLRSINMAVFMDRLLSSLSESLNLDERGIALRHRVEDIRLSADSAIPLALFIVEALGNAVEHGLERGGSVEVVIRTEGKQLELTVADTGCGVGDPDKMSGVGTRLIRGFARQLGAELSYADNAPGLKATLSVPREQIEAAEQPFQVRRQSA